MDGQRFYEAIYFLVTLEEPYFPVEPLYLNFVFPYVLFMTILVSGIVAAIYYNVINNITSRLGYLLYWFIFMFIAFGLSFYIAVNRVANEIYPGLDISSDGWVFGLNNIFISIILFFLFSMILKWRKISVHADHIPFRTPW